MKIAILGTRGIPNNYGGFEQVTEYISAGLVAKGHEVFVYNSHNHPFQNSELRGVQIIHCYDPEYLIGTPGQFIYDFNCIRDAGKRDFDLILFMGYTSSSIWRRFFPKKPVIVSNMDGLEWQRKKYSKPVQFFLRYAEKLAVKYSHFHIVDSMEILRYYKNKYGITCEYIPYGASLSREEKEGVLNAYGLTAKNYYLLMARMEPENNVDLILEGFQKSNSSKKFMVIGNTKNNYGRLMLKKYADDKRIVFTGSIFDQDIVDTLRTNSVVYFHGHSVGGTNPSLLEAMASKTVIAAHDNGFNKSILRNNAFYFTNPVDVKNLIELPETNTSDAWIENNFNEIKDQFNWQKIIDQYNLFLTTCYKKIKGTDPLHTPRYVYE
jgi:glycosyltransferase involved in cell wall biosynthesis